MYTAQTWMGPSTLHLVKTLKQSQLVLFSAQFSGRGRKSRAKRTIHLVRQSIRPSVSTTQGTFPHPGKVLTNH